MNQNTSLEQRIKMALGFLSRIPLRTLSFVALLTISVLCISCSRGAKCELCGKRKSTTHSVKYLLYGTYQLCNECESDVDDAIATGIALELLDRCL